MQKFNFTIHIVDQNASHNGLEDRLYEAGCDDTLVCSINKIYI